MKKALALTIVFAAVLVLLCGCFEQNVPSLGNVVILGDSFSTFEGYIPDGYPSWYKPNINYADVCRVEHTWWHIVVSKTKSNLLLNSSYSGSTVCNTGYDGVDSSAFSFVTRITELANDGFFEQNSVDTLIVYGGLNDCWAQSPRGEIKYDNISDADLYSFYPALSAVLNTVVARSPSTKIIVVIEEQLDDAMKDGIEQIATHYGALTVVSHDVDLYGSHPSAKGMKTIANQIIDALKQ